MFDQTLGDQSTANFKAGLKRVRKAFGLTRDELCADIGIDKATLKAWEKGAPIPDDKISNICLHFGIGRNDLFNPEMNGTRLRTSIAGPIDDLLDNHWGVVGLGLENQAMTRWFPITVDDADMIAAHQDMKDPDIWLFFRTLANRHVIVNPAALDVLDLIEAEEDTPEDDWDFEPGISPYGMAAEIYRLWDQNFYSTDYFIDGGHPEGTDALRSETGALTPLGQAVLEVEDMQMSEEDVYNAINSVQLTTLSGKTFYFDWDKVEATVIDLVKCLAAHSIGLEGLDSDINEAVICLNADGYAVILSVGEIACITWPEVKLAERALSDLDA